MPARSKAPPAKPRAAKAKPQAPAVNTKQGLSSAAAAPASTWALRNLTPTDEPGVFLNTDGVLVDKAGVSVDFKRTHYKDSDRLAQALGRPVSTPAELLCAIALDDTQPLHIRMDAATRAAPYYDRKQPQRVETEEVPTGPFSAAALRKVPADKLEKLWAVLEECGLADDAELPTQPSAKQRGATLQ